jgi:cytidine deaminase
MAIDARPLTAADEELVAEAEAALREHHVPGRRRVASALRAGSGEIYATANLETAVDNASVHCEPITVANALDAGETTFETTVAVLYPGDDPAEEPVVVSACGVCRELLRNYCPGVSVVFQGEAGPVKAPVEELLPGKG